jgi:hypothetical protein
MPLTTRDVRALELPELVVVPPVADPVLAGMARFREGSGHAAGRAEVVAALPAAAEVRPVVVALTRVALSRAAVGAPGGRVDALPIARAVPVAALGRLLGLADSVPPLVRRLCDALAAGADVSAVTAELAGVPVAALSVLFQAHDAVAAAVGLRLLGRDDPPVRNTRRRAVSAVALADVVVPAGETVVVDLGGIGTFGAGRHGCPGRELAEAVTGALVETVWAAGWRAVRGQPVTLLPRPNLSLPASVWLARAG